MKTHTYLSCLSQSSYLLILLIDLIYLSYLFILFIYLIYLSSVEDGVELIADGCEKDSFNWWGLREEHSAFGYLHHDLRKRKEEKIKINEEIYREKKKRELEEIEEERKKKEEERRVQQEKLWKAQALQKSVNSGSGNIQNYIPHSVQYQNNNHNYNHKSRFRDAPSVPIGTGWGEEGLGRAFFRTKAHTIIIPHRINNTTITHRHTTDLGSQFLIKETDRNRDRARDRVEDFIRILNPLLTSELIFIAVIINNNNMQQGVCKIIPSLHSTLPPKFLFSTLPPYFLFLFRLNLSLQPSPILFLARILCQL